MRHITTFPNDVELEGSGSPAIWSLITWQSTLTGSMTTRIGSSRQINLPSLLINSMDLISPNVLALASTWKIITTPALMQLWYSNITTTTPVEPVSSIMATTELACPGTIRLS